jgi:hypothetical protein
VPHEPNHTLSLTANEIHTLVCAMAGNFPESLNEYRLPLLRKLAHASVMADITSDMSEAA